MSPIVVPNTDPNLTTLEEVRQFMQKGGAGEETEQDDLITALIPQASQAIQRFTRIIAPAEDGATKTFTWRSGGCLSFDPWFCRSVTSIAFDGGSAITTGLTLEPVSSEDAVFRSLDMSAYVVDASNLELQDPVFVRSLKRSVAVIGDWGYAAIPEDVTFWANVTIREWIATEVSAFTSGFDATSDRFVRGRALPEGVIEGLKPWARDKYL